MDKEDILEKLLHKKVQDYSFTILFFLVFSFFVVFAIRPNLLAVVTLQEQISLLKGLDVEYEKAISEIINLQSVIEQNRDNFFLLDQSLPSVPQVNKVLDDIRISASDSGMPVRKIDINDVSLKENRHKINMRSFVVNIETQTKFDNIRSFITSLLKQRRLKTIRNISIAKEKVSDDSLDQIQSTASAALKIKLEIDGFYL